MRSCLVALLALAGCVDHKPGITGAQSLQIDLVSPADPGSQTNRLPPTANTVVVNITAIGPDGQPDTTFSNDVQVYLNYLGTLTPYLDGTPLTSIRMTAGRATNQTIMLPLLFGPATLWFDDGKDAAPTYATGTSPTLWFRDPFIADIQTPTSETAIDAFSNSPLVSKNITVEGSRYGAAGRLVVQSVFAQGYTVSDMMCTNGNPPCVAGNYDHAMVFSFSAAADQDGRRIVEGQTISGFSGGISEFNGLTEIGFPQTFVDPGPVDVNPAREPAPVPIDLTWFTTNKINFERNEAGPIAVAGAKVCPLDADYDTYKQWKLDPAGAAGGCANNLINVISTGVVQTDPATLVGMVIPRVVGILRPVNIGTFNVWIIYPRGSSDLTLP
jgi:hypothetical protein